MSRTSGTIGKSKGIKFAPPGFGGAFLAFAGGLSNQWLDSFGGFRGLFCDCGMGTKNERTGGTLFL